MNWHVWLAVIVILGTIYGLYKKWETRLVLVVAGFVMCFAVGQPLKAMQAFVKGLTNPTLVPAICSVMGFAVVMTAAKCDVHLVTLLARPLKKLGGWLIPITTALTFCINIAVMSAAGTAACAGASFIPLLIKAGIHPAGAAASVAGGTIMGLMLNPGNAHSIYIAKIAEMNLMSFIAYAAPYAVAFMAIIIVVNSLCSVFVFKDHRAEQKEVTGQSLASSEIVHVDLLRAVAPLVPLIVLLISTVYFPKLGIDVVAAMLIGCVFIAAVTRESPTTLSKSFFKGLGAGYVQIIGLIMAAGVFVAGLQATGCISAFINLLKNSSEFARWGAALGPFLMAVGTGSGEAATWSFNQAVTPYANQFGMAVESVGYLAVVAGQFGRTASPLAGAVIVVAGMAACQPMEIAKRTMPGMAVALIVAAIVLV